jgi:cell division protein FtsW (lipid II flippase)
VLAPRAEYGLALPFISYGGPAVFAGLIAIGTLQSLRRRGAFD